ncbi:MAG: prepilin-type N-terminal cleavage/methylation domain-containing protein [Chthoniobacterales bacterium]|nr:prepilin-type N-terminal cleavage/methylation domain-containing protein [Chthoniobacterales bacterium]
MNKKFTSKMSQAFSLVELLVVIAVIAIIAGIAIPQIMGTRDAALGARTAAQNEEITRFINNVNAVGATNATGAASSNNLTGTFSTMINGTNVSFTLGNQTP